MEKLDNAPEEEAVKETAREFMKGLVGTTEQEEATASDAGIARVKALKELYNSSNNATQQMMEKFWSDVYDPRHTSIWRITYDESDSIESLHEAIDIVQSFMKNTVPIQNQCFGLMHTLENLEIEGLWVFNGPNPEEMYGVNEDSSWFTFTQIGPEVIDYVKEKVASLLIPSNGAIEGRSIKDTQVFTLAEGN